MFSFGLSICNGKLILQEIHSKIEWDQIHPTDPVQEDTFGLRFVNRGPVGPTLGVSQFVAVRRAPQGRRVGLELVNANQRGCFSGFAISSPETLPLKK